MNKKHFVIVALSFGSSIPCGVAYGWDGPPELPGVGASNLLKPASYLDADFNGFIGSQPYDSSTARGNFVLSEDEKDTWQANFKLQNFHFEETLPLAIENGTEGTVPTNLWTADFGLSYSHKLESDPSSSTPPREWGLNLTAGSESNVLFNSYHELTLSVTGTYRLPTDMFHGWMFFLNESTNRPFLPGVPLPGVGYYSISPTNHTQLFLGIPFFFGWQPTGDWNLFVTYFIPTSMHAGVEYKLSPAWKAHADFTWLPQSWLRADRPDESDHLIFDCAQVSAGFKVSITEPLFFNIYGGYAFDQQIFEAQSLTSSGKVVTDLPPGEFVNAEIALHL
jgi:hypothetical protein